jgi:4-hydroxy-tetrahydrodipicolinate synthase
MQFSGTYTAIVTPFHDDANQTIDFEAFDALVEAQIEGGISGLVPCGTTGESPTLSQEEQAALVLRTVKQVKGRAQVIAGTGSNSTHGAIDLSRAAERAGADAVMAVVPYYNKPTQEGLYRHFLAVAESVRCPVMIYNIPGRTGIDLQAGTVARICEAAPNVRAIKEATGNVLRAQELVRLLGDRISVLSGDDALTVAMMAVGARGVVSVTSNLLPREVARVTATVLEGDSKKALALHLALVPVHEVMFIEANPSPVKAALASRGRMKNVVRLPLVPLSDAGHKKLVATLATLATLAALA